MSGRHRKNDSLREESLIKGHIASASIRDPLGEWS